MHRSTGNATVDRRIIDRARITVPTATGDRVHSEASGGAAGADGRSSFRQPLQELLGPSWQAFVFVLLGSPMLKAFIVWRS